MPTHRTANVVAEVELLEGLETAPVEHVRAIQNVDFAVPIAVVANRAISLVPACSLVSNWLPEGIELFFISRLLFSVLSRTFTTLLPNASHVRQEAI